MTMSRDNTSLIKKAADIISLVMHDVEKKIKPGITEKQLASFIRRRIVHHGGRKESFKIIVSSGIRSHLVHGYATNKKIRKDDCVIVDCGAVYRGYCSDITRTFFPGHVKDGRRKIYDLVKKAQQKAIMAVKSGVPVKKIDRIVRECFGALGLENHYPHTTGHGIGVKVHEFPRISVRSDEKLSEGMVVTIEPGLYFKNKSRYFKRPFGVRIEDMVLVKKNGCEILTTARK